MPENYIYFRFDPEFVKLVKKAERRRRNFRIVAVSGGFLILVAVLRRNHRRDEPKF